MYWQAMAVVGGAVLAIVALASLLSIRRVLVLEPAVVFRGAYAHGRIISPTTIQARPAERQRARRGAGRSLAG